jgi:hypothetical protein
MFACCGSMSRRCSSPVTPSFLLPFLHPALEVRPSAMRRRRATQSGLDKKNAWANVKILICGSLSRSSPNVACVPTICGSLSRSSPNVACVPTSCGSLSRSSPVATTMPFPYLIFWVSERSNATSQCFNDPVAFWWKTMCLKSKIRHFKVSMVPAVHHMYSDETSSLKTKMRHSMF